MAISAGALTPDPLAPEHGLSLLVSAEEAAVSRRRRERPAEVGRYLLIGLGAICAGASSALWVATRVSAVAVGLLVFGLLLLALGLVLHRVLVRDRERWPEEAHAWADGIEVLLHDGELQAAAWTDPKLALDLFVQPRRSSPEVERVMEWRMDAAIPPCDLSEAGLTRLLEVATAHKLQLTEYRKGRKNREARAYLIRGSPTPRGARPPRAPADPARSTP